MSHRSGPKPKLLATSAADPCDGCHECGLRCTAGIQITEAEFERIVAHLREVEPKTARRILTQEKEVPWFEEITARACVFYDVRRKGCLVYPARPFICRLFGRVEWLPCPVGKSVPPLPRGLQLLQDYAHEKRLTFEQWLPRHHILDPLALLTPRE